MCELHFAWFCKVDGKVYHVDGFYAVVESFEYAYVLGTQLELDNTVAEKVDAVVAHGPLGVDDDNAADDVAGLVCSVSSLELNINHL